MASRTISVTFLGDASKLRRTVSEVDGLGGKVSKSFKGVSTSVGSSLRSIASVAAASVGAFAGIEFGRQLISGASDLNESISKTQVIFGGASTEILRWSQTTASALGTSRQEALDAAATFATFGKSAGLGGTELSGFAENLTGLSADLASFYNASPTEAIDAIGAALRGESEPIRRFGVLLDDATLKNEALKLGLIKTTKNALTPQQKVLAAQAAIMRQTSDAQGDFGRTSGGLANQQRILSAKFADVKAKIGQALLPVMTKIVGLIGSRVLPIMSRLGNALGPVLKSLGSILSKAALGVRALVLAFQEGDVTSDGFVGVMERVGNVLRTVWFGVKALVSAFRDGDVTSDGFVGVMERVGNVLRDVWAAVRELVQRAWPYLVQFFQTVKQQVGLFVDYWRSRWDDVKKALQNVLIVIGAVLVAAFAVLRKLWETFGSNILGVIQGIWNAIKGIFDVFIGIFSGDWQRAWDGVKAIFGGVWDAIRNIATAGMSVVTGLVSTAASAIVGFISSLPGRIVGFVGAMLTAAAAFGKAILDGILNGLGAAGGAVADFVGDIGRALKGFINDRVLGPIRNFTFTLSFGPWDHTFKPFGSLPRLAKGGVIDQPTLAMLGDGTGRNRREIATPEALLRDIVRSEGGGRGGITVHVDSPLVADARFATFLADLIARQVRDSGPVAVALQGAR